MGKIVQNTSPWVNLKPEDVSPPDKKTYGLSTSYATKTHADLRRDPKFQEESEKLLSYLAEQQGAAEALTGGLVSSDIFETLRDEEGRLLTVADRARVLRNAPEDIKQTYSYLRSEFENSKPGSYGEVAKAVFDRGVDLFTDPVNLALALVAPAMGNVATKSSAAALSKTLSSGTGKESVRRTLNNISASNTGKATAFEGAAWTGIENANRQDINITTGIQDSFSKGDFGLSVAAGGVFGGALGYGATRIFSRSSPSVAETPPVIAKKPFYTEIEPYAPSKTLETDGEVSANIEATLTGVFDNVKLRTDRTGKQYFDRNNNPEVDITLLKRLGNVLDNQYDDIRVANIILGIKDTIFKRLTPREIDRGLNIATRQREIKVNDIDSEVLNLFNEYGLTNSEIQIAIKEVRDTYIKDGQKTAKGKLKSGQEVKVTQRIDLTDEDIGNLSEKLAGDMGGGQRTSDVLADAIAEANATRGISTSAKESSILSRALNKASRLNAKYGTGKVSGILDPYINAAPNVIGSLQQRITSSLSNSWKRGEAVIRDTNDYATVFDREFGRLAAPFKDVYEPILLLAKGSYKEEVDLLLSNAIRTGDMRELSKATQHLSKDVRKGLVNIVDFSRNQLKELGDELQARGFVTNLVDNYLPRLWKRSEIEADKDNFINLLEKNVAFEGNAAARRKGAEDLYDELLNIKYQLGNESGTGMNSFFARRQLVLKDETAFTKYLDNDLNNVMISYHRSAAKSFAKDSVFNARNVEEFRSIWIPAMQKEMQENGASGDIIKKAAKDMEAAYQNITGEGLERFGETTQKLADSYMLANRMALLPLSTLSSLTEIFINVSKAGPKTAFAAYRDAIFNGSKKMYDDSLNGLEKSFNMTRKEAMEELNYMGIALDQAFADYADRLGGDALANPTMRKISNKFFRFTLLDQWTRGVQTASYITGKRLIAENLESIAAHMPLIQAGKTSRRVQRQIDELADLGINYNEGVEWLQQGAKTGDNFYTKLKEGAGVYTNEVILNPSAQAGIKPMYMSNPKTAILGQLLGYPAAFTNTILKNVVRESSRNPETILTQHLPAAAMMTGVAVLTNAIRTQGESLDEDPEKVIGSAIARWGGNGLPADMFMRGRTAAQIYQSPTAYVTGLGPLWGDTYKLITSADIFSILGQKVPGYGAFNAVFGASEVTEDFPDDYRQFLRDIDSGFQDVSVPPQESTPRRDFRKGGEVYNVIQAPIEPDERIDKMTGLPYDIQAGEAFVDEEDRNIRQGFALGTIASKAAPVLKSVLDTALDTLAAKGDNIPLNRLSKRLSEQGVRLDEQKASGITDIIEFDARGGKSLDESNNFTTTRKGNSAITPQGLQSIKATRVDRPLVDAEFVTAKETEADRWVQEPISGEYSGERVEWIPKDSKDLTFHQFYESVTPEDVVTSSYEVKMFGDPRVPTSLRSPHFYDTNFDPNNPAAQVFGTVNPASYWVRFDDVSESAVDPAELNLYYEIYGKSGADRLRVFEMQTDIAVNEQTLSDVRRTIRRKMGDNDLVPTLEQEFGIDKKNISFTQEQAKALKDDAAKSLEVENKVNEVYQIIAESGNYSPSRTASRPRDYLGNINDMYLLKNFFENEYIEEYVNELQQYKKIYKKFLKENPKLNSAINRYIELKDDIFEAQRADEKIAKHITETTRNIMNNSPIENLDVSQNIINRMIAEARRRGRKHVSFLIGTNTPTSKEYLEPLKRSKPIQDYYSNVVAKQVKKVAKKIGGTTNWDAEGYLTIALPEKEFTLPMYKNEGGYISRQKYGKGGISKLPGKILNTLINMGAHKVFGVDHKAKRKNEKDAAAILHQAILDNKIPTNYSVPVDKSGYPDFQSKENKKLFEEGVYNEEVFNALNHGLLSYRQGSTPIRKEALQIKEAIQESYASDPRNERLDAWNNARALNLRKQNLTEEQVMQELVNDYERTTQKLINKEPLIRGEDSIYSVNDLPNFHPAYHTTDWTGITMPPRNQRNTGGKILGSLHRNCT